MILVKLQQKFWHLFLQVSAPPTGKGQLCQVVSGLL